MPKSKTLLLDTRTESELSECPVMVYFQNGLLKENAVGTKNLLCVDNTEINKKEAVLAVNNNIYKGVVDRNQLSLQFVAVRNKITNKMRLIQYDKALVSNQILFEKDNVPPTKHYDADLAKKLLLKNFGGKKATRHLQRAERMKVNLDTIKGQLETTINNVPEEDENETNKANESTLNESSVKDIVPPFNKEAKKLDEIYNLSDIISQNLLDRLDEEANEILVTEEIIPISSEFLLKQINDIRKSSSKTSLENTTKIKIYLYMDALMNLLKCRTRNMSKANLSNITEKVENDIRLRFSPTDSSVAIRTTFSSDKALCYFITLALLTSPQYQIDINVLIKELSKPKKKIQKYAQLVHAKLKNNSDVLMLKLPEAIKPPRLFVKRKQ